MKLPFPTGRASGPPRKGRTRQPADSISSPPRSYRVRETQGDSLPPGEGAFKQRGSLVGPLRIANCPLHGPHCRVGRAEKSAKCCTPALGRSCDVGSSAVSRRKSPGTQQVYRGRTALADRQAARSGTEGPTRRRTAIHRPAASPRAFRQRALAAMRAMRLRPAGPSSCNCLRRAARPDSLSKGGASITGIISARSVHLLRTDSRGPRYPAMCRGSQSKACPSVSSQAGRVPHTLAAKSFPAFVPGAQAGSSLARHCPGSNCSRRSGRASNRKGNGPYGRGAGGTRSYCLGHKWFRRSALAPLPTPPAAFEALGFRHRSKCLGCSWGWQGRFHGPLRLASFAALPSLSTTPLSPFSTSKKLVILQFYLSVR